MLVDMLAVCGYIYIAQGVLRAFGRVEGVQYPRGGSSASNREGHKYIWVKTYEIY